MKNKTNSLSFVLVCFVVIAGVIAAIVSPTQTSSSSRSSDQLATSASAHATGISE